VVEQGLVVVHQVLLEGEAVGTEEGLVDVESTEAVG
jgi:hypothetical protein